MVSANMDCANRGRAVTAIAKRALLATIAALGLFGSLAQAADMPRDYLPPPPPERTPVLIESAGGWYIRGDLGGYWGIATTPSSVAPSPDPSASSVGKGFVAGLGAGFKSRWLRTDFTVNYMSPMQYTGTVFAADDTTAKIQSTTLLVNGYIDLGTWYRITPYIGGGVGTAYVSVSDYVAPLYTGENARRQWNFAWAAMAGLAFPIAPNLLLDAGYRYVNAGNVAVGDGALGGMNFKNVAAHEVRVGLRWSFDDIYTPR